MAFDLRELKYVIDKRGGLSKKPYFAVRMLSPRFLSNSYARDFEYLCMSASLPGLHFDTVPIRPLGYGTPELRPYDTVTNNIRCDLLVDTEGRAFEFFHRWMGNINNFGIDRRSSSSSTGLNYYEFAYPEEYESVLEVIAFDNADYFEEDEVTVIKYTLNQAFPVDLGDIEVNWDSDNQINILPVTFAYNIWSAETLPFNASMRDNSSYFNQQRSNLEATTPTERSSVTGRAVGPV